MVERKPSAARARRSPSARLYSQSGAALVGVAFDDQFLAGVVRQDVADHVHVVAESDLVASGADGALVVIEERVFQAAPGVRSSVARSAGRHLPGRLLSAQRVGSAGGSGAVRRSSGSGDLAAVWTGAGAGGAGSAATGTALWQPALSKMPISPTPANMPTPRIPGGFHFRFLSVDVCLFHSMVFRSPGSGPLQTAGDHPGVLPTTSSNTLQLIETHRAVANNPLRTVFRTT